MRPHCVQLCLAPEIRSALIKYMAKNDLDKEYAALLLLVKSLYQERLIEKEVYEFYSSRYSQKLCAKIEVEAPKLSVEALQAKQRLDEKTRQFSMVLDQWNIHGADWRRKWVVDAEKYKDQVEAARLILDLGGKTQ